MSVLVDTSVWVSHFRKHNEVLAQLLSKDLVLVHPVVQLELACGTPPAPRQQTLEAIGLLQAAQQPSWRDVADFIERESLFGQGCGVVDIVLLMSALLTPGARLWTLDKCLADLAIRFNVLYQTH